MDYRGNMLGAGALGALARTRRPGLGCPRRPAGARAPCAVGRAARYTARNARHTSTHATRSMRPQSATGGHPCWLATVDAVVPQCAARGARRALLAVAAGLGHRVRSRPPARMPRRAHRPCEIWRVRACVRVCVRVCVRTYARWELKEGHGGQILAAVAIPAHECAADSLPPARLRASVARPSATAIATLPPSFPRTASQAALRPVGPHLRLPAPQARAQAALSSDGHKPLTTKRMGVQVHILPRTLRLQCGYGPARIFAGADSPGRPAGSRSAVFSAAPGSGDSACTASDVCCGGTPPEGRMPLDAPPTSARRVCAVACRKWR